VRVSWIAPDARLACARGEVVICIPVYGGHEQFAVCIESVLAHTPEHVPILICDDASPDQRSRELVARLEGEGAPAHQLFYLRREHNLGFPANVNGAFALATPADVVVLNSDCEVAEGWLEGMLDAAASDSRVATVSTLTNHGSIVSVPERNTPTPSLPAGCTLERASAAVRAASLRIRPRLPTAIGHCVLIRRAALELVGDFDEAFSPGYGEEVDFSQRCLQRGLCHVLADEVLVRHRGGASFSPDGRPSPVQERHERMIAARHPCYHDSVRELEADVRSPLARALSAARRALRGTSVVIDARILGETITGTQLQVLEVIAALARSGELQITAIVPGRLGDYARQTLSALPDVRVLDAATAASQRLPVADLVHRPYQVAGAEDVALLAGLGERLVITNQDLIAYHNPSYFAGSARWRGYRRLTRGALGAADHVVFLSEHALGDALAEDLVDPARTSVVRNGVDHTLSAARPQPAEPRRAQRVLSDGRPALLCLGTDFHHKNRLFALRLLAELRSRHGWPGALLLAGPHVDCGSSTQEEARLAASDPALSGAVLDLGIVSEAEKAWLYERSSLVLYPTVQEGFGLVPFEAADHDRPCLWAPGGALAEVLPPSAGEIVPWDPEQSALGALRLLGDERARADSIAAVRAAARELTWERVAAELLDVYRRACDAPAAPGGALAARAGPDSGVLSADALMLVGPGGALPPELERPLLALATHPRVSGPMFDAVRLGYRAGYVWRRRLGRVTGSRRGGAR
jgi:GT2 family glycosyltransferase/glycosyltransferase involved in cell wall biosynthesis